MGFLQWAFGGQKEADKFGLTIKPFADTNKSFIDYGINTGKENLGLATDDINFLRDYFKNFLTGTPDEILKNIDASQITNQYDDQFQNVAENSVRGGMRAGDLSNLQFQKAGEINKVIQMMRQSAPDKMTALAALLAQIGQGQLNFGKDANDTAINIMSLIQSVKAQEKARKAGIFGDILKAAGGALGGFLGGIGAGGGAASHYPSGVDSSIGTGGINPTSA